MYSTTRRSSSDWTTTTAAYTIGLGIVGLPVVASLVTPLVLGTLTVLRQQWRQRRSMKNAHDETMQSTLLVGRVWHTRFRPVKHAFTYPLFMFGIELDEEHMFAQHLWPLSLIMNFSPRHHLCNGEGMTDDDKNKNNKLLRERIYTLVKERTNGYLQPTVASHRVWLVTHLSYYGYCFNPVSFYYLLNRSTGRMEAVVAEVFNTPWIEMYAYVLHPTSIDKVRYTRRTTMPQSSFNDDDSSSSTMLTNFKFPKTFHVSPFMEMDYTYDWTFGGQDQVATPNNENGNNHDTLRITTAMVLNDDNNNNNNDNNNNNGTQFSATVRLHRAGLHPLKLAWQLAHFPCYCVLIQAWIHFEAFWLFVKGVPYQPHPQGAETTASRLIGAVMTPLFQIQDWLSSSKELKRLRPKGGKTTSNIP